MALKNNWEPLADGESLVEVKPINDIADAVILLEEKTAESDDALTMVSNKANNTANRVSQQQTEINLLSADISETSWRLESTAQKVSRNDKRITNIEQGVPSEQFMTDSSTSYIKNVPSNALQYAEIEMVGGMTYKDGDTLKSAIVTDIESIGTNLFDESQITHATNSAGTVSEAYGVVQNGELIAKIGLYSYGIIWKPFAMSLGAGTYTISADCYISTGGAPNLNLSVRLFNTKTNASVSASGVSLSAYDMWERISAQITVAEPSEYMLSVQGAGNATLNSNMDVRFKNICVAKGNIAEYSPYKKKVFRIPEAVQTLDGYGEGVDSNNFNSVEWSEDGKRIFNRYVKMLELNGSESWTKETTGNTFWTPIYNFKASQGDVLSSRYSCSIWDVLYVNAASTGVSTVDEFKAALRADPLCVVYILDTPETTDISDLLPADNFIGVESNGTVTMVNEHKYAVPSEITYMLKEA